MSWYKWTHKGFHQRYMDWVERNCLKCPFANMKEHMRNEDDRAFCWAEVDQNILSRTHRYMYYIFYYYETRLNGCDCLLKSALEVKEK